ncbi:MAG: hypothetical protein HUJ53_02300 [Holdemanella sp.]|nr:hypothetical protein [Holdemanella sp.]
MIGVEKGKLEAANEAILSFSKILSSQQIAEVMKLDVDYVESIVQFNKTGGN